MKYWMIIGQFLLTFAVQADSLSMLSAEGFGFADAKRFPESQARLMAVRAALRSTSSRPSSPSPTSSSLCAPPLGSSEPASSPAGSLELASSPPSPPKLPKVPTGASSPSLSESS